MALFSDHQFSRNCKLLWKSFLFVFFVAVDGRGGVKLFTPEIAFAFYRILMFLFLQFLLSLLLVVIVGGVACISPKQPRYQTTLLWFTKSSGPVWALGGIEDIIYEILLFSLVLRSKHDLGVDNVIEKKSTPEKASTLLSFQLLKAGLKTCHRCCFCCSSCTYIVAA